MKYAYPAIFSYNKKDNCYYVKFPDIENCFTDGETLPEAIEQAEDVLALMLCQMEDDKADIPAPADVNSVKAGENDTVSFVFADTMEYRRLYDSKAVKKTLSIPSWLNAMAEKRGINFSAELQAALKNRLGINE